MLWTMKINKIQELKGKLINNIEQRSKIDDDSVKISLKRLKLKNK